MGRHVPRRARSMTGQVAILMVGLYFCLFVLAGATVDGGRALATKMHAIGAAQQAARAGANQLSKRSLYAGGSDVDITSARAAAMQWLADDHDTGSVTVSGHQVHVVVTATQPTILWRLIGVGELTLTETGTADATRSAG